MQESIQSNELPAHMNAFYTFSFAYGYDTFLKPYDDSSSTTRNMFRSFQLKCSNLTLKVYEARLGVGFSACWRGRPGTVGSSGPRSCVSGMPRWSDEVGEPCLEQQFVSFSGQAIVLTNWIATGYSADGKYLVPTTSLVSLTRLPVSLTTGRDYTNFFRKFLEESIKS